MKIPVLSSWLSVSVGSLCWQVITEVTWISIYVINLQHIKFTDVRRFVHVRHRCFMKIWWVTRFNVTSLCSSQRREAAVNWNDSNTEWFRFIYWLLLWRSTGSQLDSELPLKTLFQFKKQKKNKHGAEHVYVMRSGSPVTSSSSIQLTNEVTPDNSIINSIHLTIIKYEYIYILLYSATLYSDNNYYVLLYLLYID